MQSNTRLESTTSASHMDVTKKAQALANAETLIKGSMMRLIQLKNKIDRMQTDKWDAKDILELLETLPKYHNKKIAEFYTNKEFNAQQFLSSETYVQLKNLLQAQIQEYLEISQALKITPIDDSITAVLIIVKMQTQRHLDDKKGDYIADFFDKTLLAQIKDTLTPFISEYHEHFCDYICYDKNYLHITFNIEKFMLHKAEEREKTDKQYDTPYNTTEIVSQRLKDLGVIVVEQNQQKENSKPLKQLKDFLMFYHGMTRYYLDTNKKYRETHAAYKHYQACYEKLQHKFSYYFKQLELIAIHKDEHRDAHIIIQSCLDECKIFSQTFHTMWREKPYTLPSLTDIEKLYQTAVGLFDRQIAVIQSSHGKIMPMVKFVTEYKESRNLIAQKLIQLKSDINQNIETYKDSTSFTELTKKLTHLHSEFLMQWPEDSYSISLKFDLTANYDEIQRRITALTDALNAITKSIEEKNLREQQALENFRKLQISRTRHWQNESQFLKKSPDNMTNVNPPVVKKDKTSEEPKYTTLSADLAQKIRKLNSGHIKSLWKIMDGNNGLRFKKIESLISAMGGTLEIPGNGSSHRRVKFLSLTAEIEDTKDDEALPDDETSSDDETEQKTTTPQTFVSGIFKPHGKSHHGATQPQINVNNLRDLFIDMGITVDFIDSVLAGSHVPNTTQLPMQNTKGM